METHLELLDKIIHPPKKQWIATFFEVLHFLYEFLLCCIILFVEDLWLLIFAINICFMNIVGVFLVRRCPLEYMIQKHTEDGRCYSDHMRDWVKGLSFLKYECDHVFENHLQLLGTAYAFLSTKIT
jgi:hypothetical protein